MEKKRSFDRDSLQITWRNLIMYNKEHVQDEVIFRHLKELSENRLDLTSLDSLEKEEFITLPTRIKTKKNNLKNSFNNHNKNRKKIMEWSISNKRRKKITAKSHHKVPKMKRANSLRYDNIERSEIKTFRYSWRKPRLIEILGGDFGVELLKCVLYEQSRPSL